MRSVKAIIPAAALALATLAGTAAATAPAASAASAEVLVNADGGTISLGHSLNVGVWYQKFSGGPSSYWEGVWSYPQGKWIFTHSGNAVSSHWQDWSVKPAHRGKYATVYGTSYGGRNYRTVFYTTVR